MTREHIGSITFQVNEVMKTLIAFGESKHAAKESFKAKYGGSKAIDEFMHDFGKLAGIYSHETFKDYLAISIRAAEFIKSEFGIRDIKNLTGEHIKTYLQNSIDSGKSRSTFNTYAAALEKFETALTVKYGQKYDFKLKQTKFDRRDSLINKERAGTYAYTNTAALIKNIDSNKNIQEGHKLAIRIELETGVRIHKSLVNSSLKLSKDGTFYQAIGKGGRPAELKLSSNTEARLRNYLSDGQKETFKLSRNDYKAILKELKSAAAQTGQANEGTHGLKKSFATDLRSEIIATKNLSYKEAVNSREYVEGLAHNRRLSTYEK